MTTIVTRAGKGSPLTNTEMDTNLTNLNTAKTEAGTANTWTAQQIFSADISVVSLNGGQLSGFKNIGINGDMSVSQVNGQTLVTSGVATDVYVIDQHIVNAATAAVTAGQSSDAAGLPTGFAYNLKIAGAASNTNVTHKHRIEAKDAYGYAGRTISVSFWMYQDSGAAMAGVTVKAFCPTTTADVFSAVTQEGSTVTVSVANAGTIAKYTAIIVLGSTNCAKGLEIQIATNAALLAGKTMYLAGYQVEGVAAGAAQGTAFEHVPYQINLSRCQRYLPLWTPSAGVAGVVGMGQCYGTTGALLSLKYPVRPRITPTGVVVSSVGYYVTNAGYTPIGGSTMTIDTYTSEEVLSLNITTAGSLAAGNATALDLTAGTKIYATGVQL